MRKQRSTGAPLIGAVRSEKLPQERNAAVANERRSGIDRRRGGALRSLLYGLVYSRRRGDRRHDNRQSYVDWYEPHLFASALIILLLCALDAFLTLTLLRAGAQELNPFMDALIRKDIRLFVGAKLGLTFACLITLVLHKNFYLFRTVPVSGLIHFFMLGYVVLIAYEAYLLLVLF